MLLIFTLILRWLNYSNFNYGLHTTVKQFSVRKKCIVGEVPPLWSNNSFMTFTGTFHFSSSLLKRMIGWSHLTSHHNHFTITGCEIKCKTKYLRFTPFTRHIYGKRLTVNSDAVVDSELLDAFGYNMLTLRDRTRYLLAPLQCNPIVLLEVQGRG